MFELKNKNNSFFNVTFQKLSPNRELWTDFLWAIFREISLEDFVKYFANEYSEAMQYIDLCDGKRACQKTSLLFNPHRLDTRTKTSKNSVFSALKDRSFISGLVRASFFKKNKYNNSDLLYQVLQIGINGVQFSNEFPPHIARDVCKRYGIRENSRVLDPCAGWGGRMIGISTISDYYQGFDPSTKTCIGLNKLSKYLTLLRPSFNGVISCIPYEKVEIKEDFYDIAITSPPYFDTENYSDEPTNSLNLYQSFDKWVAGFYKPLINNTMKAIKRGRPFILNIGSRVYPLNKILFEIANNNGFKVKKLENMLQGNTGLGKSGEGEAFYEVSKPF